MAHRKNYSGNAGMMRRRSPMPPVKCSVTRSASVIRYYNKSICHKPNQSNMKRFLFAFIAVAFVLQSCSDNKAAFNFNQKLAGISESLNKKGTELSQDLKIAMTTRDFTKVKERCDDLKKYIDEKITEVKNTKDVGSS